MSTQKNSITCPTCQKPTPWRTDNPFRPFCSDRCKLIDLGEWADEGHRLPGEPIDPDKPDLTDEE